MSQPDRPTSPMSRRSIAKGAAWAVPALVVGAPAPALAASGEAPSVVVGQPCKLPTTGNACETLYDGFPGLDPAKGFAFPLLVVNNTPKPIVLQPSVGITSSGLVFTVEGTNPASCTPVSPGAAVQVIVYANSSTSANAHTTLSFLVPWGHDCADTGHAPIVVAGIVVDGFPSCSTRVPFPTGDPTCNPPFYQS